MKLFNKIVFLTLVLTLSASIGSARAQELFGVGFLQAFNKGDTSVRKIVPSGLYSINPNTGAATFIGEIGFLDCTGLDFHTLTKELFAVCFDDILFDSVLVKVNPATGEGELIGPLNLPEPLFGVDDISFRSDGVLFAHSGSKALSVVGIIDTTTGNFSQLGNTGLESSSGGLAFSTLDILFYAGTSLTDINNLFTINQQNGSASFDKPVIFVDQSEEFIAIQSLETNLRDGRIFAIYTAVQDENAVLGTLDPDTGLIRDIGPTSGIFIRAIASRSSSINIPMLSEYGLIATALVLFGVATFFLMRRRKAVTS